MRQSAGGFVVAAGWRRATSCVVIGLKSPIRLEDYHKPWIFLSY